MPVRASRAAVDWARVCWAKWDVEREEVRREWVRRREEVMSWEVVERMLLGRRDLFNGGWCGGSVDVDVDVESEVEV